MRKWDKEVFMVYLIIAIAILGCFILFFPFSYLVTFYSPYPSQNDLNIFPMGKQFKINHDKLVRLAKEVDQRKHEDIFITSFDGLKLYGRYYEIKKGAPLAIYFHGYRGVGPKDFCGGFNLSLKMEQNILLVDQRAHGISGGHTTTFGIKEKYDVKSWVDYAVKRYGFDTSILLYGVSMGASTILMSLGLDLPRNVVLIIADSPYISVKNVLMEFCKKILFPPHLGYFFLRISAFLFGNFKTKEGEVVPLIKNSRIPILIIHGEDDKIVPVYMSQKIKNAYPEQIQLEIFPKADHGLSYIVDKDRYENIVFTAVKKALNQ